MKTMNSASSIWTSLKQTFFVLQVVIIALAIPVLSYLEMSYDIKPSESSVKAAGMTIKQNAVAFSQ